MESSYLKPHPVKAAIGRLALRLLGGWTIEGRPPEEKKYLLIAAHHTSNWDFVIGVAVKLALGLQLRFFAKHSLFFFPLGVLMRSFGGVAIKRDESLNRVDASINEIKKSDRFVLVITPEGTRSKVDRWKTGFYHIAKGADIPIASVAFDFQKKKVVFGKPFQLTDDKENDIREMHRYFLDFEPKFPELACHGPFEK